jgi:hypothetical protein
MQLLREAKNVPNAARASQSEACSWLLKSSGLKVFASAANFDPVPNKEEDMTLYSPLAHNRSDTLMLNCC